MPLEALSERSRIPIVIAARWQRDRIGFRGEVKEADEQTAKVAVQVFGRVTPVDLALGQIESVKKKSN
jgi:hypothetical protein